MHVFIVNLKVMGQKNLKFRDIKPSLKLKKQILKKKAMEISKTLSS